MRTFRIPPALTVGASNIHQLPQNLVGLLVILFSRAKKISYNGIIYYETESKFGVSLGNYIILHKTCTWYDVCHEYGHQKQSLKLGWLYLFIIGLPSFTFNIGDRIFHKKWQIRDRLKWYYKLPWEHSADKLGGVDRSWLYEK